MSRIIVVGSANTDMIVKMESLPKPGETVLGGEFVTAAGGKGANQAVAAARLGAEVTFFARVGTDALGDEAVAGYEAEGIDTGCIVRDDGAPSGVALILVDGSGENMIAVASGANARLRPADIRAHADAFEGTDVLLTQLETPVATILAAAEIARAHGLTVILNPAPAPRETLPPDLLALVDILVPNQHEAAQISGLNPDDPPKIHARELLKLGPQAVIITLGKEGALLATRDGIQKLEAFRVDPVDTTAAGDAFLGGLAVALAEGQALPEAVRFSSACGALAATRLGAQPSLPTRDEVAHLLNS